MPIDWLKATIEERQILYRQLKDVADRKNASIEALCFEILGCEFSSEYAKTLRSGKYSCKNAFQFYKWLRSNKPDAAARVDEAIEEMSGGPAGSKWQALLEDHAREDGCRLAVRRGKGFEIVGLTRLRSAPKIKLGQDFYLHLDCPKPGTLGALQSYNGAWYRLPLIGKSPVISVTPGERSLPLHPDTGKIDYLSEANDTGPYEFVLALVPGPDPFELLRRIRERQSVPPAVLDAIGEALADDEEALVWRLPFQIV